MSAIEIPAIHVETPVPKIEARRDLALNRLGVGGPVHVCSHMQAGLGIGIVCAEHPPAGILCGGCAAAHIGRHTYEVEHRCDECGEVRDEIEPILGTADGSLVVLATDGTVSLYVGPIAVIAIGVCMPCRVALDLPGVVE